MDGNRFDTLDREIQFENVGREQIMREGGGKRENGVRHVSACVCVLQRLSGDLSLFLRDIVNVGEE